MSSKNLKVSEVNVFVVQWNFIVNSALVQSWRLKRCKSWCDVAGCTNVWSSRVNVLLPVEDWHHLYSPSLPPLLLATPLQNLRTIKLHNICFNFSITWKRKGYRILSVHQFHALISSRVVTVKTIHAKRLLSIFVTLMTVGGRPCQCEQCHVNPVSACHHHSTSPW